MAESSPIQNPGAQNASSPATDDSRGANPKRKQALLVIASVVALAGIGWGLYDWLVLSHYEETDNAYVQGNLIQITPQVGGTVTAIFADETEPVQAGQVLVRLDPADTGVALTQAEAALGQTVRQVRTLYLNNASLAAQVRLREADLAKAHTLLATAQQDLARRQGLTGGAVSGEELAHTRDQVTAAQSALDAAEANLAAAREQLSSNQALTDGTPVEQHPSVQAAAAKLREAWLAAHRTELPAPVSGYVGKRIVQLGQRVAPGSPLMILTPLDQLWVDANFKENQLRGIRIGQPVTLTADVYGGKVKYRGKVAGLGVATGAATALLPAQNATGNWIKVVQRVPVRIALDAEQIKAHPLRVGLSMEARVDISDQSGAELAAAPRLEPIAQTQVYAEADSGAEALIQKIIAQNMGRTSTHASAAGRGTN
ncbi:efflux RND transporter periplasmic adaptor subunit [Azonexus sp.]|jgi:membrane fusion protein (multidrug efflux system)|uniref:efflux RND transporter periplasmic adaptor subunit n=1 Tax=Azonexus sp. TaxID=1872668 RepID=UPI002838C018|nr:efflux RND transporter periplasmic adaptor subunit [Azonexus sp.]MDR1994894.1 efflux RND transporter periplasmic adaptor subunit [Azonexus sp.]